MMEGLMKVTRGMIDRELCFRGQIAGLFMNILFFREIGLRITKRLAKKVLMGNRRKKLESQEVFIDKRSGGKLRARIYRSLHSAENAAGILWIHGGGYVIGAPEMDIGYMENLISSANCVIISPDYTLSTEKPYPAALEDCYEALVWLKENAPALGIRDDQLFVGGLSAGGGLTAAVALMARDKREVNIAFMMPLYPMIDDMMDTDSARNNNAPIWNSHSNKLGWKMYLRGLPDDKDVPKYAAPTRETDFSRLPPTYTFVGDIEPFYNETITFIDNLQKAGVSAKVDVYKGCYHAFDTMCPKASISKKATDKLLKEFRFAVENYFVKQDVN